MGEVECVCHFLFQIDVDRFVSVSTLHPLFLIMWLWVLQFLSKTALTDSIRDWVFVDVSHSGPTHALINLNECIVWRWIKIPLNSDFQFLATNIVFKLKAILSEHLGKCSLDVDSDYKRAKYFQFLEFWQIPKMSSQRIFISLFSTSYLIISSSYELN